MTVALCLISLRTARRERQRFYSLILVRMMRCIKECIHRPQLKRGAARRNTLHARLSLVSTVSGEFPVRPPTQSTISVQGKLISKRFSTGQPEDWEHLYPGRNRIQRSLNAAISEFRFLLPTGRTQTKKLQPVIVNPERS